MEKDNAIKNFLTKERKEAFCLKLAENQSESPSGSMFRTEKEA
jgi:hypothetical protein